MRNTNTILRGFICTLSGAVAWGFSGACGQYLTQTNRLNPIFITFLRMLFSGLILTCINIIKNKKEAFGVFKTTKTVTMLIFFAILGLAGSQLTYLVTISYSNAGTATILQYIGPVLIMLAVCCKTRKLPDAKEIVSIFMAFVGVVILATHGNFGSLSISGLALGWGFASAIAMVFYSMLPEVLMSKWGTIGITGWGMFFGGILMGFLAQTEMQYVHMDIYAILAISGMIVIGTVFAYTLYMQGVKDLGPSKASMLACVEPVSAVVFSALWHGTEFALIDILGFVLILSTVFILGSSKKES